MTKRIVKLVSIVLVALLVVYFVYQAYMILYPTYKTEIAVITKIDDNVPATGIIVRDETVIESSHNGVRNYLINDGDKVADGSSVAEIYATPQDALDNLSLTVVQKELDEINRASDEGRTAGTNPDTLSNLINNKLFEISGDISKNDYSNLTDEKIKLFDLLNSYSVATGEKIDLTVRKTELEDKVAELNERRVAPIGYIKSPVDGYFVSSVDGMEGVVNKQDIFDMPVDKIADLVSDSEVTANSRNCKIVKDYTWYYAAVIDVKDAARFRTGSRMSLDFNYSGISSLPAKVLSVKVDEELKKAVVLVECNYLTASLSALRCERANLSFKNFSGIKVNRSALHIVDGKEGVFVKYGSLVVFKEINRIYEDENFILSGLDSTRSELLALYDEIIVEGKDLYVGKNLVNS